MSGNRITLRLSSVALFSFFFILFNWESFGVPAAPGYFECVQPDGKNFKARLIGDEFYHHVETQDGYSVSLNKKSGWYEYLKLDASGKFTVTGLKAGIDDPAKDGIPQNLREAASVVKDKVSAIKTARQAISLQPLKKITGPIKTLVILANFSDTTPAYASSDINSLFNTTGYNENGANGSVNDYFDEATYNQLDVQATVSQWVTLPQTKAYYGANDVNGDDVDTRQMVIDAIAALDTAGFDFSPFDADGDGWLDVPLDVIHQGKGEEAGGGDDCIWSHAWALSSAITVDGVKIQRYHSEPEQLYSEMTTIGVICHEMGHAVCSLPDLYDTDKSSEGIGSWCLMAAGSWNGISGNRPAHFSAWCKVECEWVTPQTLPANQSGISVLKGNGNKSIFKITNGMQLPNEYFLIENRQKNGFDDGLPAAGLLVWHVDDAMPKNTDETHYKVALLQADGNKDLENNVNRGDAGDPYPGSSSNKTISSATNPNTDSYANGATSTTISNISDSADTMTFNLELTKSADIDVKGNGESIISGSGKALPSNDTYFGAVSAQKTFTITNLGPQDLNLTGTPQVSISGVGASAFSVTTQPSSTLAPSASSSLVIQYTYTSGNAQSAATVSIPSNDPGEPTFTFTIAGGPEIFPEGAVIPTGWTEPASGSSAPWTVSTSASHEGVFSLASGDIADLKNSIVEKSGLFDTGNVTFWYKVSSETDYDYLVFYVDEVEQQRWAGELDWTQASFLLSMGQHTLKWSYEKDEFTSGGSDKVWIDLVSMPILESTIAVTSPNGGETWYSETTRDITWTSANLNRNVKIELLKNGISDSIIIADTANTGTYSWPIPITTAQGNDYSVKISDALNSATTDESDAVFSITEIPSFNLTIQINLAEGGTSNPIPGQYPLKAGTSQPIKATPNQLYNFDGWSVTGSAIVANLSSNDTTVTLSGDATVTANFSLIPPVTAVLTMAVNPASSGTTAPVIGTSTVVVQQEFNISATAEAGYSFTEWTATANATLASTLLASTKATLSGNATITANFSEIPPVTAVLTMAVNPATSGNTLPVIGTSVIIINVPQKIAANAATGFRFTGWTAGAGATVTDSKSTATTVTLSSDATVTANFEGIAATAQLTIASSPAEGGTTVPTALENPTVNTGSIVNISATPETGYNFLKWSASTYATLANANSANTTVVLTGDATVTANFAQGQDTAELTMGVSPAETGTTTPIGTTIINTGAPQDVSAIAEDGYFFLNWSADNAGAIFGDASSAETTLTINSDTTVTANFAELPNYTDMSTGRLYTHTGNFNKSPKVVGIYSDPITNVNGKKAAMKVITKVKTPVLQVICEWKAKIGLRNKKLWNKTLTCEENLFEPDTAIGPLKMDLWVNGSDSSIDLYLVPPEIEGVYDDKGNQVYSGKTSDKLVIKGTFFGTTPPIVWMEYPVYQEDGETVKEIKSLRLKCDKILKYKNSKNVLGKSCMDIETGLSEISVHVPDKWPKNWDHLEYHNIVIDNKIGRATTEFQTEE